MRPIVNTGRRHSPSAYWLMPTAFAGMTQDAPSTNAVVEFTGPVLPPQGVVAQDHQALDVVAHPRPGPR